MPNTKAELHPVVGDDLRGIVRHARPCTQPAPITPITENDRAFCIRLAQRGGEVMGTNERRAADLGMSLRTYKRRVASAKVKGLIEVNGAHAPARAGVAVTDEETVAIEAIEDAEVVLLDLP